MTRVLQLQTKNSGQGLLSPRYPIPSWSARVGEVGERGRGEGGGARSRKTKNESRKSKDESRKTKNEKRKTKNEKRKTKKKNDAAANNKITYKLFYRNGERGETDCID